MSADPIRHAAPQVFTTSDGVQWELCPYGNDSPRVSAQLDVDTEYSTLNIDLSVTDLLDLIGAIHEHEGRLEAKRKTDDDRHAARMAYLLAVARGTDENHTNQMRQRCITLGAKIDD